MVATSTRKALKIVTKTPNGEKRHIWTKHSKFEGRERSQEV